MTTLIEEKHPFRIAEAAASPVAGRPHNSAGSPVELMQIEARYELLLGTIVPDGVPVVVPPLIGPVSSIDRIVATRRSRARELPALSEYPHGQDLVVVDEDGVLGAGVALTLVPRAGTGDAIPGHANNRIVLGMGACLRLRRGRRSNAWVSV